MGFANLEDLLAIEKEVKWENFVNMAIENLNEFKGNDDGFYQQNKIQIVKNNKQELKYFKVPIQIEKKEEEEMVTVGDERQKTLYDFFLQPQPKGKTSEEDDKEDEKKEQEEQQAELSEKDATEKQVIVPTKWNDELYLNLSEEEDAQSELSQLSQDTVVYDDDFYHLSQDSKGKGGYKKKKRTRRKRKRKKKKRTRRKRKRKRKRTRKRRRKTKRKN